MSSAPTIRKAGVIYSNLSTKPHHLYDDSAGMGVNGGSGAPGIAIAVPFSANRPFVLTRIELAVLKSGWPGNNTPGFRLGIFESAQGKPFGAPLLSILGFTTVAKCCALQTWTFPEKSVGGLSLKGGLGYWLTVEPNTASDVVTWAFNNTGANGGILDGSWTMAVAPETLWDASSARPQRRLPAFAVFGEP